MSFSDPQSITINSIAISMPRTATGLNASTYTSNDGLTKQTVSHQYGKRNRRQFRVDVRKIAADPLTSGVNSEYSMSAYLVVDLPKVGYTNAEAKLVIDGLLASLTASSGAKITSLLGGEN